MKPILIVYATRDGHTHRIAEHVAAALHARDLVTTLVDAAHLPPGFTIDRYAAAVLAASVRMGKHEREMIRFVKAHRAALEQLPTAFLSVSMAEGGVEDPARTEVQHAEAEAGVHLAIDRFLHETGWKPARLLPVAGALLYTKYDVITRFVMRMIARRTGAPTDTSKDHVLTDWEALDRFVGTLAVEVEAVNSPAAAA